MAAIITPEQVLSVYGATVTAPQIAAATRVIEAVTGLDLEAVPLPLIPRDVRHLRAAVAWQARYMLNLEAAEAADRPGNLTGASANGVSVSWGEGGSAAAILSPLARMALRRLSSRGSSTVRMVAGRPPPSLRAAVAAPQTLTDDGDPASWRPM